MKLIICEASKFCDKVSGFNYSKCKYMYPFSTECSPVTHCSYYISTYPTVKIAEGIMFIPSLKHAMWVVDYIHGETKLSDSFIDLEYKRRQDNENISL